MKSVYTNSNSIFPKSGCYRDEEKAKSRNMVTLVGQAIEHEWFNGNTGTGGATW